MSTRANSVFHISGQCESRPIRSIRTAHFEEPGSSRDLHFEDHPVRACQDILPVQFTPFVAARRPAEVVSFPVVDAPPAIPLIALHALSVPPLVMTVFAVPLIAAVLVALVAVVLLIPLIAVVLVALIAAVLALLVAPVLILVLLVP